MNIVFDLKSFTNKLFISIFVILVFYFLYLTIPDTEFDNVSSHNCKMDRLVYTVSVHTGRSNQKLLPVSTRAKILSMLHMLISFSIIIL